MSAKPSTGQQKTSFKRPFSSFKCETSKQDFDDDNVFGFMDDCQTSRSRLKSIDDFPIHDLTEDPTYLMEFGFGNGFLWNEEVLLSPPFSNSASSSYYSPQSSNNSNHIMQSSSYQNNKAFPSLLAEKLRKKRISQETKVAEIRID